MRSYHYIILLIFISFSTSKVVFSNLNHKFQPSSEKQYLNYIQLLMGQHQQSTILSQNLQQIIKEHRPSLLNIPQQTILYIMESMIQSLPQESDKIQQNFEQNNIEINGQKLANQLKSIINEISIKIIKNSEQQMIQKILKNHQKTNEIIHVLKVDKNDIKHFNKLVPNQSGRKLQQKSVSQQAPTTDSTYLIKFFFSIIFVIVIISIIGFISDGSSKKDTLLYAKFIADVGNR